MDEFEHIHVIKKLKQILNSWWNIDVVFTDERGQLRGGDKGGNTYCNPAVATFLSKETSVASLSDVVSKTLEEIRTSGNRYSVKKWDTSGFDMAIIPITIENDFMGCVVALGFMKDRQAVSRISEVRERMAIFGASGDTIDKAIGKISFIDDQDREHFLELVELVAQEVVTLHLEITSRENRIKELNKELAHATSTTT